MITNDSENSIVELEDEGIIIKPSLRIYNKAEVKRLLSRHPVTSVSWHAAKMMADWLSEKTGFTVRLPTEAEWEFACCSGSKNFLYGTKNGKLSANTIANYVYGDGFYHNVKSVPVTNYPPNNFGLYDLSGNVSEWCEDWYQKNYYSNLKEHSPLQAEETVHKVVRGGSYDSVIKGLGCSTRNKQWPDLKTSDVGFRLVIVPSNKENFEEMPNLSLIKLISIKGSGTRKKF